MTIKAVLFDFGDTLFTFGKVNARAFFREGAYLSYNYLQRAGAKLPAFRWYYYENMAFLYFRMAWSVLSGKDFDSSRLIRLVNSKLGMHLNEEQWQEVAWLWYEPLSKRAMVEPDIRDTLSTLREMGLGLGIVSNTFLNYTSMNRHLEQFGMLEFFPLRMYSYETSWRKPNIRIYQEAAKRLNLEPANIAFVGDRLDTDIRGAIKAGMVPVLKVAHSNEGKTIPAGVEKVASLAELPALIRKLNNKEA